MAKNAYQAQSSPGAIGLPLNRTMKKLIKGIASLTVRSYAFDRFVRLLERTGRSQAHLLRILTYHRVDEADAHPNLYPRVTVSPSAFDAQMRYLAKKYYVISMPELLFLSRHGGAVPPNAVMVTFDDAYCDFAGQAWPILKRYNLPVTLFVPTAFPGKRVRSFWWDDLYHALRATDCREELDTAAGRISLATEGDRNQALTRLRDHVKSLPHDEAMAWVDGICRKLGMPMPERSVLSWDTLRQLARQGVTLGAHTQTHPLLNRVTVAEARSEAVGSLRDLEREIGSALPIFAYPSGGFNDEVVRLLKQAGFELAFTTVRGINDWRTADRLRLRRINVGPATTLPVLRAQLLPVTARLNAFAG